MEQQKDKGQAHFVKEDGKRPNSFKSSPDGLKPRERMKSATSLRHVPDDVLLAVLLNTGASGCDVGELAKRLISLYPTIGNFVLAATDFRRLKADIAKHNRSGAGEKILGVGEVKLLVLSAALELARRALEEGAGVKDSKTDTLPDRMHALLRKAVSGREEQENFFAIPLDNRLGIIAPPVLVSRGTSSSTPVHPKDVFREAVRWGADSIVIAHNHPSGSLVPSREDISVTGRLSEAAAIVGVRLLDHLIFSTKAGSGDFVSMKFSGLYEFT